MSSYETMTRDEFETITAGAPNGYFGWWDYLMTAFVGSDEDYALFRKIRDFGGFNR